VTAGDADYDAVRAACVWNGDIDRRPWVIAQATSTADVVAAVGRRERSAAMWLSGAAAIISQVPASPMTR